MLTSCNKGAKFGKIIPLFFNVDPFIVPQISGFPFNNFDRSADLTVFFLLSYCYILYLSDQANEDINHWLDNSCQDSTVNNGVTNVLFLVVLLGMQLKTFGTQYCVEKLWGGCSTSSSQKRYSITKNDTESF